MQPAPASPSPAAQCPSHAQPAAGTCERCGTFYCAQCGVPGGVCPACLQRPVVLGGTQQPMYFAVSTTKLAVMALCTLGLYDLVWFYRNWKLEKERTGQDISPFWRTFFAPFFFYDLLKRMNAHAPQAGATPVGNMGALVAAFILLNLCTRLPGALWMVGLLSFLPLMPAQRLATALNASFTPLADRNTRFTAGNIAWVVVGGLFLALGIIGSFLPDVE